MNTNNDIRLVRRESPKDEPKDNPPIKRKEHTITANSPIIKRIREAEERTRHRRELSDDELIELEFKAEADKIRAQMPQHIKLTTRDEGEIVEIKAVEDKGFRLDYIEDNDDLPPFANQAFTLSPNPTDLAHTSPTDSTPNAHDSVTPDSTIAPHAPNPSAINPAPSGEIPPINARDSINAPQDSAISLRDSTPSIVRPSTPTQDLASDSAPTIAPTLTREPLRRTMDNINEARESARKAFVSLTPNAPDSTNPALNAHNSTLNAPDSTPNTPDSTTRSDFTPNSAHFSHTHAMSQNITMRDSAPSARFTPNVANAPSYTARDFAMPPRDFSPTIPPHAPNPSATNSAPNREMPRDSKITSLHTPPLAPNIAPQPEIPLSQLGLSAEIHAESYDENTHKMHDFSEDSAPSPAPQVSLRDSLSDIAAGAYNTYHKSAPQVSPVPNYDISRSSAPAIAPNTPNPSAINPAPSGEIPPISVRDSVPQPPIIVTTIPNPNRVSTALNAYNATNPHSAESHTSPSTLNQPSVESVQIPQSVPFNNGEFVLPPTSLLNPPLYQKVDIDEGELDMKGNKLLRKLKFFKIDGDIADIYSGPVVTTFEFRPAPNIKVSRIQTLQDDISMELKASSIRIQAPIPGKDVVGIEIPNNTIQTIYIREIFESAEFRHSTANLAIALGKDIVGQPIVQDLAKLPHLLIAGTTGSGKSVGLNGMILSLLYKNTPKDLRFIMIDPKRVELSLYKDIPHLLTPIIAESKKAIIALGKAVDVMNERYEMMNEIGVKNITGYNEIAAERGLEKLPYIVIIIDEFADLMITGGKDAENSLISLASKARASGIHLIIATQRPTANVVTGLIKSNLPSKISFRVGSAIDSKVVLDRVGAESLLGNGDMLFSNTNAIVRYHAPYSHEKEIERVADFIRSQQAVEYDEFFALDTSENPVASAFSGIMPTSEEEYIQRAKEIILETQKTSISYLQRALGVGFNKAANIMESLEKEGFLSPQDAKGKREIIR